MATSVSKISTTVRTTLHLTTMRAAFQVFGLLNPRTTLRAASSRAKKQKPVGIH